MAWIQSHQEIEKHPKTHDLMALMEWSLDTAIGKLHRFWWWCASYAEDGDLRKYNEGRIADAMGVPISDSKRLVEAMVQSGWIDRKPYLRVHDWWVYMKYFLMVKYKGNSDKLDKIRLICNEKSTKRNNSCNNSSNNTPNTPSSNGSNTALNKEINKEINNKGILECSFEKEFDAFWDLYPKKLGKKQALRHFKATVKTPEDLTAINKALENYKTKILDERTEFQFIKNGDTWFNNWREYVEYKKPIDFQIQRPDL